MCIIDFIYCTAANISFAVLKWYLLKVYVLGITCFERMRAENNVMNTSYSAKFPNSVLVNCKPGFVSDGDDISFISRCLENGSFSRNLRCNSKRQLYIIVHVLCELVVLVHLDLVPVRIVLLWMCRCFWINLEAFRYLQFTCMFICLVVCTNLSGN